MFCATGKLTERTLERQEAAAASVETALQVKPVLARQHTPVDTPLGNGMEKFDRADAALNENCHIQTTTLRSTSDDKAAIRSRLILAAQNIVDHGEHQINSGLLPLSPRNSAVRLRLERKAQGLHAT